MEQHANVSTVESMTAAIVEQDKESLAKVLTHDVAFHLRGPWERAGDYTGVDGVLEVIGSIFELTNGDIDLERRFCMGTEGWASEWEHAILRRNGKKLESDNAFVYRFDGGRIAEMWMFLGADPDEAAAWIA